MYLCAAKIAKKQMTPDDAKAQAEQLYQQGNAYRKEQQWDKALNAYEQAYSLDPTSPAVHARQMLMQILEYRCKAMYNP